MQHDLLIRGATLLDGTGADPFIADVAIKGDRIVALGQLAGHEALDVIEAQGLTLTPGFIDVHTHDDTNVVRTPDMLPKLSQGVTTVVVGNCGISASPVQLAGSDVPDPMNLLGEADDFVYPTFAAYAQAVEQAAPAINVAALVGHTSLRSQVMQDLERPASKEEIAAMRASLEQALAEGAIGMSTGLAYRNARQAPSAEVAALVRAVSAAGGIYTTHLRDEFAGQAEAMDEAFATARDASAPLVISHLKCAGAGNWGQAPRALSQLTDAATQQRVHCDCYPYTAGSSTLDLGQVTDEIEITITWSKPHPEQARRPLAAIAADWEVSLLEAAKRLQPAGAVYHNMCEEDMREVLAHPLTMVGSDGLPNDPHPHPRLWGAFPRVLAHYSRDLALMAPAEAVRKMTGLSAATFGLEDRGVIRQGAFADLVLLDLEQLDDSATYDQPKTPAQGILRVWVNGHTAYTEGRASNERNGRMLRRSVRLEATPL